MTEQRIKWAVKLTEYNGDVFWLRIGWRGALYYSVGAVRTSAFEFASRDKAAAVRDRFNKDLDAEDSKAVVVRIYPPKKVRARWAVRVDFEDGRECWAAAPGCGIEVQRQKRRVDAKSVMRRVARSLRAKATTERVVLVKVAR